VRYVATLLLLLNLLYFVYSLEQADAPGREAEPQPGLRNTGITLLSEVSASVDDE